MVKKALFMNINNWIPAFAGMTDVVFIRFDGQIPRLRPRSCDSKNEGCARDDSFMLFYDFKSLGRVSMKSRIWSRAWRNLSRLCSVVPINAAGSSIG